MCLIFKVFFYAIVFSHTYQSVLQPSQDYNTHPTWVMGMGTPDYRQRSPTLLERPRLGLAVLFPVLGFCLALLETIVLIR